MHCAFIIFPNDAHAGPPPPNCTPFPPGCGMHVEGPFVSKANRCGNYSCVGAMLRPFWDVINRLGNLVGLTADRNLKPFWRKGPTWPCTARRLNGIARFVSSILSKEVVVFRCLINMACHCLPPRRYSRLNSTTQPCTQMIICHGLTPTPSKSPRLIARP